MAKSSDYFQFYEKVNTLDKGVVVVSRASFKAGDLVGRFSGRKVDQITQHSMTMPNGDMIEDLEFIGFLAHSCEPNCFVDMDEGMVTALFDIEPNELLTIDYEKTEPQLYRGFQCNCGSDLCRGEILGLLCHDPETIENIVSIQTYTHRNAILSSVDDAINDPSTPEDEVEELKKDREDFIKMCEQTYSSINSEDYM